MLVDSGEEEWQRLHDVRLNGTVLEYIGRGKSLVDVGLAQARTPIGTRNHYFEIEVRPSSGDSLQCARGLGIQNSLDVICSESESPKGGFRYLILDKSYQYSNTS